MHLTADDVDLARAARARTVCACPTTEADLATASAPFRRAARRRAAALPRQRPARAADLLAEAQRLELHERLRSGERGRRRDRVAARARPRRAPLPRWATAGRDPPGHRLDLVALASTPSGTAGAAPDQVLTARPRPTSPTSWSTARGRARGSAPPRRRGSAARRRDRAALGLTPLRSRGLSAARRTARSPRPWSWSPSGSARGRCGRPLRTAWSRSRARPGAPGACTRRRAQRRAATGRARRCR